MFIILGFIGIICLIILIKSYNNEIEKIEKYRDVTAFWNDPQLKHPQKDLDTSLEFYRNIQNGVIPITDLSDTDIQYYEYYKFMLDKRTKEDSKLVNLHHTKWNFIYGTVAASCIYLGSIVYIIYKKSKQ